MKVYKAGIIGTGKMAGLYDQDFPLENAVSHAYALRRNKHIKLVAACDRNRGRLAKFTKAWKVPRSFTLLKSMLDTQALDLIAVCSSTPTHAALTECILGYRNCPKIVLVEKPLCRTKKELEIIKRQLKSKSRTLIVNHPYRFNKGILKLKNLLARGHLGKPLSVRGTYYGGFINNGVHMIDLIRFLLATELKVTRARKAKGGRKSDPCLNVDFKLSRFPKASARLESFDEKFYEVFEMEIICEKGRTRIMDFGREIFIDRPTKNLFGENELKTKDHWKVKTPAILSVVNGCVDVLRGKKNSILHDCGIQEAERTMNILWEVIRLRRKQRHISVRAGRRK